MAYPCTNALCVIFMILVTLKNVFWVVARLPQRLKSTFFEIFAYFETYFAHSERDVYSAKVAAQYCSSFPWDLLWRSF